MPLPQVTKLKMYPYFDLAHAALCCLAVRDDLANGEGGTATATATATATEVFLYGVNCLGSTFRTKFRFMYSFL